jgi:hypothetical protein
MEIATLRGMRFQRISNRFSGGSLRHAAMFSCHVTIAIYRVGEKL